MWRWWWRQWRQWDPVTCSLPKRRCAILSCLIASFSAADSSFAFISSTAFAYLQRGRRGAG